MSQELEKAYEQILKRTELLLEFIKENKGVYLLEVNMQWIHNDGLRAGMLNFSNGKELQLEALHQVEKNIRIHDFKSVRCEGHEVVIDTYCTRKFGDVDLPVCITCGKYNG